MALCPDLKTDHVYREQSGECVCGRHVDDGDDDFCEVVGSNDRDDEWVAMNGTRAECEYWVSCRRSDYPYERAGYGIVTIERVYS